MTISAENPPSYSSRENASSAEMAFAGHYLNLGGILLLIIGLASYLKSAEAASAGSNGLTESVLGAGLGLVLLVAGENYFRKGLEQYSHPLLTGGFCLLFFSACSAHFRHGLIGQGTLFAALLPLVIGSNASVFRYNSKLIGNVMLVVYFFTPLFMTFRFGEFNTIFAYLLAINLGTTVVAFSKKWDFQLLVGALGSYAFYFIHFRGAPKASSLTLLVVIYALSLLANSVIHFYRPEDSDTNRVVSCVNPIAFAALSSTLVLGLPNQVPVLVYFALALIHAVVAKKADARRYESPNFRELATSNLVLAVLFMCASISFITYFSTSTTYFGLVTLLWYVVALALLGSSFALERHRLVLSRCSYLAMALATFQVAFVLSSMVGSGYLQALAMVLNVGYFILLYRRPSLSLEQRRVMQAVAAVGVLDLTRKTIELWPAEYLLAPLLALAIGCLTASVLGRKLEYFANFTHALAALALWSSFRLWSFQEASWLLLPMGVLALGWAVHTALGRGAEAESLWVWVGLLELRTALLPLSESLGLAALVFAAAQLGLTWLLHVGNRSNQLSQLRDIAAIFLMLAVVFWTNLSLPILFGVVAILSLSHYLDHYLEARVSPANIACSAIILTKTLWLALAPNPLLSLALGALLAAGLMRASLSKPSIAMQGLVALSLLMVPLSAARTPVQWATLGAVVLSFVLANIWAREEFERHASGGLGALAVAKICLMVHTGPLASLSWGVLALILLRRHGGGEKNWNEMGQGLFDYSRVLFLCAFIKSIVVDANAVGITLSHSVFAVLLAGLFLLTGHTSVKLRDARTIFVLLGLLTFAFHTTAVLHQWWGDLMMFQPLLSGFWSLSAFLIIATGIAMRVKVYRLFGLVTLVGSALKILAVDIHVLDSYSQTNTYLILGTLLMTTSLLYQKQRERLCGEPQNPVEPELLGATA